MLTTNDIITTLGLHGTSVRDRAGELFIRSEFDRLVNLLMRDTYVTMLVSIPSTAPIQDSVALGERIEYARKTLRNCHSCWLLTRGDGQNGLSLFEDLVRWTAPVFRFCMSPEVEEFWASRDLLEDGRFMRYLAPAIAVIRQFLDDRAGVTSADEACG
jgi:hypothetical protein